MQSKSFRTGLHGSQRHGDCDRKVVLGWHALAYLTLMVNSATEQPKKGENEVLNKFQVTRDFWENLLILHKSQQGAFPTPILAMEQDRSSHRIVQFFWKNVLLFCIWLNGVRRIIPMFDQCASFV